MGGHDSVFGSSIWIRLWVNGREGATVFDEAKRSRKWGVHMSVGPAPYTVRSFVDLANLENRRGKDISRLDPEVGRVTRALRAARQRYLRRAKRYARDSPERLALRAAYRVQRSDLRKRRDAAIESALRDALRVFEDKFSDDRFSFELVAGPLAGGKPTYQIGSTLPITYPAKQAAASVRSALAVEAPSRNSVVRALRSALDRPYHHAILKIDIERFFESIDHFELRARVSRYSSLDRVSAALTERLLWEYAVLAKSQLGLPRGVGLSSHLAELYMREFDTRVRTQPGVLFYARYVDDIVIVSENATALAKIKAVAVDTLNQLKLITNSGKTYELVADKKGDYPSGEHLEYLGYKFTRAGGRLAVGLTNQRKGRRVKRLEAALQAWLSTLPNASWPNHGHNGMLLDRIRYLAGNTKLLNSKSNVAIGLYFSNSALDENAGELRELDVMIQEFCLLHGSKMPDKLRSRIESISFVDMFHSRSFLRFNQKRVERIVSIWGQV
ncbi:antiviral reverse transcriptase Drt3a [Microbacterium sp. Root1433D1]|uniref:antiviral reverse transcriptase Drt3a n=1 Tax=Microbacterium sp. Root1433D1 TaxID=1736463 RepID=UPI00138F54F5|nr:antiviral reverse transcriptase Drt3a [Microbacterium sp. Root1433D1]